MLALRFSRAMAQVEDAPAHQPVDAARAEWELLVARHQPRVLAALLARGVRLDLARDLCQETWVRLWAASRSGSLRELKLHQPGVLLAATSVASRSAHR